MCVPSALFKGGGPLLATVVGLSPYICTISYSSFCKRKLIPKKNQLPLDYSEEKEYK